jgi:tripartite-type tricarboxylate transporter receptor subunit TctC
MSSNTFASLNRYRSSFTPGPASPGSSTRRAMIAVFSTLLLMAPIASAQSDRGPIKLLVGFPAGGTIDVVARILADQLRTELGTPVVVESKPGAGGQLAAQSLKQSAPDGRTLLLSPDHTMVVLPLTVKSPGFQPQSDFAPIGLVARYAGGFAVSKDIPARSLPEYFAWAKSNSAKASVGIPAPGSIPQFLVHSLAKQAAVDVTSVPYRGSAPLVQDLLGGQIAAGTTALGDFAEHHASGRLRVIAVLGRARSPALPDIATFAEQGYPVDWEYWLGLFAPIGTPASDLAQLNTALARILARSDVGERLQKIVFEPATSSGAELAERIRAGAAFWEPIVKSSGWVSQ